jgi:hypothetical protein
MQLKGRNAANNCVFYALYYVVKWWVHGVFPDMKFRALDEANARQMVRYFGYNQHVDYKVQELLDIVSGNIDTDIGQRCTRWLLALAELKKEKQRLSKTTKKTAFKLQVLPNGQILVDAATNPAENAKKLKEDLKKAFLQIVNGRAATTDAVEILSDAIFSEDVYNIDPQLLHDGGIETEKRRTRSVTEVSRAARPRWSKLNIL